MMYFDRDGKHNFVDKNNVVVGYDSYQDCCEHAGWMVCDAVPTTVDTSKDRQPDGFDFDPYDFDPEFFHEFKDNNALDDGGAAVFRMVAVDKPDRYLVLFNSHNGYYSHGFTMKRDGKAVREGGL